MCTACGALCYYLTLLLWHRRKLVFLDIACIHQTEEVLKFQGLVSIGAFLKKSRTLPVLSDVTLVCCHRAPHLHVGAAGTSDRRWLANEERWSYGNLAPKFQGAGQREPATGAGWRTRSGGAMGTWPRSSKEHLMIQATA
eukprot:s7945_g1.t1